MITFETLHLFIIRYTFAVAYRRKALFKLKNDVHCLCDFNSWLENDFKQFRHHYAVLGTFFESFGPEKFIHDVYICLHDVLAQYLKLRSIFSLVFKSNFLRLTRQVPSTFLM